jgi:hopanoid biosynthesis associated protein HpnK
LIINADDFGLAPVNDAVESAHREGVLTSASLMVAGAAAGQAIAIAKRMPSLRVGLHLVLAEGAPALPAKEISELVDDSGRFHRDMVGTAFRIALRQRARRQLRREIEAQFEAFHKTGLRLDHVNAHKHFHLHPMIAGDIIDLGRRYGMAALRAPNEPARALGGVGSWQARFLAPWLALLRAKARRNDILTPDAVFGWKWSGAMTADRIMAILARLPQGTVEIYTHPATADKFPGCAAGYGYTGELAALTNPAVMDMVRKLTRRLGGYSDMGGLGREPAAALPAVP